MPWLPWTTKPNPSHDDAPPPPSPNPPTSNSWAKNLNRTDWSHYTSAQTITISALTATTTLALVSLYKNHLRRIPTVEYLKPSFFRRRSLYGYVTRVGDGDNFHFYHTPGGRLLGWGWLRGRKPSELKKFKNLTLHVRIAGVDAPERAHFGRPEQPFGREAMEWLTRFILHRSVRVYPYRRDQYDRVVCSVSKRTWGGLVRSDVGLAMLKNGFATVYEAKFGSEFGDMEAEYRAAEARAKERKVGMWSQTETGLVAKLLGRRGADAVESPRQYKNRIAKEEAQGVKHEK
ncbi:Hypothetical protein R9X50_00455500 [Acrodontium crateriforme]|uniref:Probable endonuclease LCL3 n=1 Tax=Acrodontium crateriforme TaxID=150365 RepID=A0AAQ3M7U6_9PEZI|nr:Hypothetical protein R9X50_00455500 [Acrodontium crateriforme]